MARKKKKPKPPETDSYKHPTASSLMRPEIGTQPQFRKKKDPSKYRYDSSLDPAMSWDEGQAARVRWAEKIGPQTTQLIMTVMSSRPHPQQGFRSALGILRLAKSYGDHRLEAACNRALMIGSTSYRSVASILKHGLDQRALAEQVKDKPAILHNNVRGSRYYN